MVWEDDGTTGRLDWGGFLCEYWYLEEGRCFAFGDILCFFFFFSLVSLISFSNTRPLVRSLVGYIHTYITCITYGYHRFTPEAELERWDDCCEVGQRFRRPSRIDGMHASSVGRRGSVYLCVYEY